ncbi:MAG: hypothetical protein Q9224_005544 [Gallowayella concinna]
MASRSGFGSARWPRIELRQWSIVAKLQRSMSKYLPNARNVLYLRTNLHQGSNIEKFGMGRLHFGPRVGRENDKSTLLCNVPLTSSQLGLIALGIVIAECTRYGAGKHAWNIRATDYVVYKRVYLHLLRRSPFKADKSQLSNGIQLTYPLVIAFTKVSILLLYLRIFSPSRTTRFVIHFNLWANIIFYAVGFILSLMICTPREAIWNPYIQHYKCRNPVAPELISAVLNVVSDFAILTLLIYMVWKLQMRRERKIAISAIFATGLLGCAAGLVRVGLFAVYIQHPWQDQTWERFPIILWSCVNPRPKDLCDHWTLKSF